MRHLEIFLILSILSLPFYFAWRWLYLKFINDKRKRIIVTWISTLIITPFLIVAALSVGWFAIHYYPKKNFNKQEWLADESHRYRMTTNLIESKMLIGKTPVEVETLLGKKKRQWSIDRWSYEIGLAPGFVDVSSIYLIFDNGHVTEVGEEHW